MDVQWPLLIFGLLAGLSMGCLGFASFAVLGNRFKTLQMPALLISLVSLGIGGVVSALHMGHPGRVFYVLGNVESGIAKELIATAIAGVVLVLLLVAVWRNAGDRVRKVFAVLGLIMAFVLPFITGEAYMQGARPAWNTWFLPVMYVGAAAAMGLFAMYVCTAIRNTDAAESKAIGKAAFGAVTVFSVTVVLFLVGIAVAPYPDPTRSLDRILTGDLALLFWIAVVVAGLCVPLAVSGFKTFSTRTTSAGTLVKADLGLLVIGLVCLLAGSVAIRMIMYVMGSSIQSFIY